jgi:tetratricopeptide (TPR) repeat protein
LEEAFEQYRAMTGEDSDILAAWWLARALYLADRLDDADRTSRVAMNASSPVSRSLGLGVLASILARRGQADEAEAMAREATAFFEGTDFLTDHATSLLDLAEVLRIAGRPEEAADAVRHALDLYERKEDRVSADRARKLHGDLTG